MIHSESSSSSDIVIEEEESLSRCKMDKAQACNTYLFFRGELI